MKKKKKPMVRQKVKKCRSCGKPHKNCTCKY